MIEIRPLTSHREFEEALRLQREIWAFADVELLPVRFFVVASHIGGQVFAAFDGPKMTGFCIAIPGIAPDGAAFLHSHMMGVLPEYRDRGIGRMLKLWQRDEALARSIRLVEWTFDPLEIKNAYLDLERLGAVVTGYASNRYGITASALHGGLPTDRGIAEWRLDSSRVVALLLGKPEPRPAIDARIAVPVEIEALRHKAPGEARTIQRSVGEQFTDCFARGLIAVGFERSEKFGTYLLGRE